MKRFIKKMVALCLPFTFAFGLLACNNTTNESNILNINSAASSLEEDENSIEYRILADGTYAVYKCNDQSLKNIEISEEYNGKKVTQILNKAFYGLVNVESIKIPDSVTFIDYSAFGNCPKLRNINMPNSIENIFSNIFPYTYGVKYNEYDNAYYLGSDDNPYLVLVSAKSTDITSCNINENTKIICSRAFDHCESLKNLTIPKSVEVLNDSLSDCEALESLIILNDEMKIDIFDSESMANLKYNEYENCLYLGNEENPYAALVGFKEKKKYSKLIMHKDTKTVAGDSFRFEDKLLSIDYSDNLVYVGSMAFSQCNSLQAIQLPNTVKETGSSVFVANTSVEIAEISRGINKIANTAFSRNTSLKSIDIPDNIKTIGEWAFAHCTSLKSIKLPNTLISIESNAFLGCSKLNSFTIPVSVEYLSFDALPGCKTNYLGTKDQMIKLAEKYIISADYEKRMYRGINCTYSINCIDGEIEFTIEF